MVRTRTTDLECGCIIGTLGYRQISQLKDVASVNRRYLEIKQAIRCAPEHGRMRKIDAEYTLDWARYCIDSFILKTDSGLNPKHKCASIIAMRHSIGAMRTEYLKIMTTKRPANNVPSTQAVTDQPDLGNNYIYSPPREGSSSSSMMTLTSSSTPSQTMSPTTAKLLHCELTDTQDINDKNNDSQTTITTDNNQNKTSDDTSGNNQDTSSNNNIISDAGTSNDNSGVNTLNNISNGTISAEGIGPTRRQKRNSRSAAYKEKPEAIKGHSWSHGTPIFKVKWEGYNIVTGERLENIQDAKDLVKTYIEGIKFSKSRNAVIGSSQEISNMFKQT